MAAIQLFVGNPDLVLEQFAAYEFVVSHGTAVLSASLDLFYNPAHDFINQVDGVYQNTGAAA